MRDLVHLQQLLDLGSVIAKAFDVEVAESFIVASTSVSAFA